MDNFSGLSFIIAHVTMVQAPPAERHTGEQLHRAELLILGLAGAWAVQVGAPLVPVAPLPGTLAATALLTAFSFLALYGLSGLRLAAWHELAGVLVTGGVWYLLSGARAEGPLRLSLLATVSVAFLLACGILGRLVARLVRDRNLLLPVLLTAVAADIFTVFAGPTRQALEKAPQVVQKLSVAVPQAGSAAGAKGVAGLAMAASIGLGDYIFTALFLAAAWRHGLNVSGATLGAAAAALLGMAAVFLVPALPALPLLPFIVLGVLVPNWGRFRLSRQEKVSLAAGMVFLALLLSGFYVALRAYSSR
ncbi:MAG: hypothetical protein N2512_12950 [Armatimonadetes bacterium]|nr:hypothetical protein [Armatimonadota bacterium]